MKKLELKESAVTVKKERKLTKGELIVKMAKEELKGFIAHQIPLLYKAFGWVEPDFSECEDYVVPTGDLLNTIYINVEVDNSYLDVEDRCYEDVEVAEIRLTLDGNVFVANEDGDEWEWKELSVEELADVATSLERTYIKKVTE
jgi:hypothetical protein